MIAYLKGLTKKAVTLAGKFGICFSCFILSKITVEPMTDSKMCSVIFSYCQSVTGPEDDGTDS